MTCSIPRFLRDRLRRRPCDALQQAWRRTSTPSCSRIAPLEAERRRLLPDVERLKREQNAAGGRGGTRQEAGPRHAAAPGREPRARAAHQAARRRARRRSSSAAARACCVLPNLPHASVPVGQVGRRQRRSAPRTARQPAFDVRAAAALGSGAGARHHRLRARHQDGRRAFLGADGRRRAARARAHQLHARISTRREHGYTEVEPPFLVNTRGADRHRQPAEVRAGSVQDRRRLGSVSDAHRRSAADEPAPRGDPRRPRSCRSATRRTRRASAAKRARMAPTCAG